MRTQPSSRRRGVSKRNRPESNPSTARSEAIASLGTRLRHLLDLLDSDVQATYRDAGLPDYRPRYTPVMRALRGGEATLTEIVARVGTTHSAISQTVARMQRAGLVQLRQGDDARARLVALTPAARRLLPKLESLWDDTAAAARLLDDELQASLIAAIDDAIAALERQPFRQRIAAQRTEHA